MSPLAPRNTTPVHPLATLAAVPRLSVTLRLWPATVTSVIWANTTTLAIGQGGGLTPSSQMQGVPWGAPATHFGGGGGQGGGVFPGRQLQMVPAAAPGGQAPAGLDPVGHLSGGVPGGHGGGGISINPLGFMNEISGDELRAKKDEGYRPGDLIGRAGIERQWDGYLRGHAGFSKVVVDRRGMPKTDIREVIRPPCPGTTSC